MSCSFSDFGVTLPYINTSGYEPIFQIKRILIPLDFSKTSLKALDHAGFYGQTLQGRNYSFFMRLKDSW
jgi:hypothetical protein